MVKTYKVYIPAQSEEEGSDMQLCKLVMSVLSKVQVEVVQVLSSLVMRLELPLKETISITDALPQAWSGLNDTMAWY